MQLAIMYSFLIFKLSVPWYDFFKLFLGRFHFKNARHFIFPFFTCTYFKTWTCVCACFPVCVCGAAAAAEAADGGHIWRARRANRRR